MSDPLANAYNLLGAQGMVGPNPYLEFTGQIPLAGYAGTPTDARGNPIQSYQNWLASQGGQQQGTTLNTPPQQAQSPAAALYGMMSGPSAMNPSGNPTVGYDNWSAFLPAGAGAGTPASTAAAQYAGMNTPVAARSPQGLIGQTNTTDQGTGFGPSSSPMFGPIGPPVGAQTPQAAAPTPSSGMSQRQAYLAAMANPGPLPTYGAQMLPGAKPTGAPQPSVLAQFLAAHPGGGATGAGGYTNMPFFSTLKNLQQAGAT